MKESILKIEIEALYKLHEETFLPIYLAKFIREYLFTPHRPDP